MEAKTILETERLLIRELMLSDSKFILALLNTPSWLEFIGDRKVYSLEEAENYISNGPILSYKENGYGLWLVILRDDNTPVGMCGLLKREYLENADIGFALLPKYEGLGYGYEMAKATLAYSRKTLNIDKIVAITDENNKTSIKLLNKLGLNFEKVVETSQTESVYLFS
jgi:RimJ/RimL family protein N-acetyltransferase